jgi:hypothetical protein
MLEREAVGNEYIAKQKTLQTVVGLKKFLKEKGVELESEEDEKMLQDKIMYWFTKKDRESQAVYNKRLQNQETLTNTMFEAVSMLFEKDDSGAYRYPTQRHKFFKNNLQGRMLVHNLLKLYKDEQNRKKKESKRDEPGLHFIHESKNGYHLYKVEADPDLRRQIFIDVTKDMGNCLGGTDINKYLQKTITDHEIYLIKNKEGKYVTVIEYSISNKCITQVEASRKIDGFASIRDVSVQMTDFKECLLALVKKIRPKQIKGIDHLAEHPLFSHIGITRDGKEVQIKNGNGSNRVFGGYIWPTPILEPYKEVKMEVLVDKGPLIQRLLRPLFFEKSRTKAILRKLKEKAKLLGLNIRGSMEGLVMEKREKLNSVGFFNINKTITEKDMLAHLGINFTYKNGDLYTNGSDEYLFGPQEVLEIVGYLRKDGLLKTYVPDEMRDTVFPVKHKEGYIAYMVYRWDDLSQVWILNSRPAYDSGFFGGQSRVMARNFKNKA